MRVYGESVARLRGIYGELRGFVARESLRSGLDCYDCWALWSLGALVTYMGRILDCLYCIRDRGR